MHEPDNPLPWCIVTQTKMAAPIGHVHQAGATRKLSAVEVVRQIMEGKSGLQIQQHPNMIQNNNQIDYFIDKTLK